MCDMLETLDKWIDEIPPIEQPQRFGNKAFRTFYSKLKDVSILLLIFIISYLVQTICKFLFIHLFSLNIAHLVSAKANRNDIVFGVI